jgi:hypothetical protein
MGPKSKEHICDTLGFLIESLQQTNATLARIERKLQQRSEQENADLVATNRRVSELERWRRGGGGVPTPA